MSISALSPLDGRYAATTHPLRQYFSEHALIQKRVFIEVSWLQNMLRDSRFHGPNANTPLPNDADQAFLDSLKKVTLEEAQTVKGIEQKTKHDMKAVEYYLRERIQPCLFRDPQQEITAQRASSCLKPWLEMIHFCCTSEDINNLAYGLMLKEAVSTVLRPHIVAVLHQFASLAQEFHATPMLALTHGQPATPTTFGKEMSVFCARLLQQLKTLDSIRFKGKFNGAVGNFNAHVVVHPDIDWPQLAKLFVTSLGLTYQPYSTQIEVHDYIAELSHVFIRIHTVLLDAVQDLWHYVSRRRLTLRKVEEEVGSSTMPHKINPIDFENAEGNFGLANALLNFFATKLPVSRMQRDLSDSTVLRSVGTAFAYSSIALQSTLKGLNKIDVDHVTLEQELDRHWEVLAEPIQTVLRSHGIPDAYDILKRLTRGSGCMTKESHATLLSVLTTDIPQEALAKIKGLHPATYVGLASDLARAAAAEAISYIEHK